MTMQVNLAEKLVNKCSFADKAFFTNSGTEANEAAIKFARKYARVKGKRTPCVAQLIQVMLRQTSMPCSPAQHASAMHLC